MGQKNDFEASFDWSSSGFCRGRKQLPEQKRASLPGRPVDVFEQGGRKEQFPQSFFKKEAFPILMRVLSWNSAVLQIEIAKGQGESARAGLKTILCAETRPIRSQVEFQAVLRGSKVVEDRCLSIRRRSAFFIPLNGPELESIGDMVVPRDSILACPPDWRPGRIRNQESHPHHKGCRFRTMRTGQKTLL